MITEIEHHQGLDKLVLEREFLHLVFGYGTGDTFNALVHLAKAPPSVPYNMIIKKPQLDLVLFLLGLFGQVPNRLIVVDYWKHDFALHLSQRFPDLGLQRKFEPHMRDAGLLACWATPSHYNKILPHTQEDVAVLRAYFSAESAANSLPEGSVVLFPTAGTQFSDYKPNCSGIVSQLRSLSLPNIFVNVSGIQEYGDETIEGATAIRLSHRELIRTIHGTPSVKIIAVRSGVLDILRFSDARALVLYQPVPEGIFETCRFGLIPTNMDVIEAICLNQSVKHQNSIIEYFIRHFLASPLTP